jgi:phosphoglycolate phosphatase
MMGGLAYSTVLFDLDGTLTDSRPGIGASVRHALAGLGEPPISEEQLSAFLGPPLPEAFASLGFDADRCLAAVGGYREYFSTRGMFENAVFDGVEAMLVAVRDRGTTLGVATSKPEVFARQILEHFGLSPYFAHISGSELDGTDMLKHQVIARVLAALDVPAGAGVCMVGDRAQDAAGARAHGLSFIGVGWGYAREGELVAAGASQVAGSPAELLGLLSV